MSAWIDMAEAIVVRLRSLQVLAAATVIVDRQKDIDSELEAAIGKLQGLVTVLWDRGPVISANPVVTQAVYTVRLYTMPILSSETDVSADEMLEAATVALSDWHPDPHAHCNDWLSVTSGPELLPHDQCLLYEMQVSGRVTLPDPQFTDPTP